MAGQKVNTIYDTTCTKLCMYIHVLLSNNRTFRLHQNFNTTWIILFYIVKLHIIMCNVLGALNDVVVSPNASCNIPFISTSENYSSTFNLSPTTTVAPNMSGSKATTPTPNYVSESKGNKTHTHFAKLLSQHLFALELHPPSKCSVGGGGGGVHLNMLSIIGFFPCSCDERI